MAEGARIDGLSLGMIGAGGLLVYAGVRGKSLPGALTALIRGRSPAAAASANQIQQVSQGTGIGPQQTVAPGSELPGGTAGGPFGSYNHAQLMQLWQQAGGSASTANNAACHAMQESSGDPKVTSPNPDGGTNVGLWQLDTKGVGSGYTVEQLQNPMLNAALTVMATANGTNWSQWSTPGC